MDKYNIYINNIIINYNLSNELDNTENKPFRCGECDWSEYEEDPGYCATCGTPFELVRPGKSQPTCNCWEGE